MIDGRPGFMLSPRCRMLRKALKGGYCYKRVQVVGDDRFHEKPDKNRYSHVAEGCEYMVLGAGEGVGVISSHDSEAKIAIAKSLLAGSRGEGVSAGWML
jgi:hypothetical protein